MSKKIKSRKYTRYYSKICHWYKSNQSYFQPRCWQDCDICITVHFHTYVLQGTLDKQLYRVDRKYSMAEKKLQEQKEKERQNKVQWHRGCKQLIINASGPLSDLKCIIYLAIIYRSSSFAGVVGGLNCHIILDTIFALLSQMNLSTLSGHILPLQFRKPTSATISGKWWGENKMEKHCPAWKHQTVKEDIVQILYRYSTIITAFSTTSFGTTWKVSSRQLQCKLKVKLSCWCSLREAVVLCKR